MRKILRCIWSLCLTGALLSAAEIGENIYPRGTYEEFGNSQVCRSGKKSLHHVMSKPAYYRSKDHQKLKVEPYAVYEVTGYVKGRIPKGIGLALGAYGWNSFGWGFMSQVHLPREMKDWRKVSTRICIPSDVVDFMPLVLSNATDSELWLDDVTMVKVQEPADRIKVLEGKKKLTEVEAQLLARYYLDHGQVDRAQALRTNALPIVRADITCQIALRSKNLAETRRLTIELMTQECLQWPDGKKRVAELLGRFGFSERLAMCREAIQKKPTEKVIGCLQYAALDQKVLCPSIRETREQLSALDRTLADVRAVCKQKGLKLGVMGRLEARLASEKAALAERERAMGDCVIRLSGHTVRRQDAVIVLPDDATPSEQTAARELASNLELLTKDLVEIVKASDVRNDRRYPLYVGRHPGLSELGFQVDYEKLGLDGIHVENNGKGLVLAGGQRGVLYAVYSFLEEYLGFRWFAIDCSTFPKKGEFVLGPFKQVYVPALKMRATDYYSYSSQLPYPVQLKYNSRCMPKKVAWGDNIRYKGFVHTMSSLVPVNQYWDTHPEYYAMRDGVRTRNRKYHQLCLTNPEVLKIAKATALRWCEEDPGAQIISVSQNDNGFYCQCDKCMALAEKEGSQMGPMLHFVNAIAREIGKKYPNKVVDTLAYVYTRKPPKFVRPEPNVAIRLCSIECCFVHPLESCPFNKTFVDDIVGWSKICRRLHIWDYVINYSHSIQPFPNLRVLKPNIKFFIEHGVTGIYEEANYFSRGAELAELRTYLMGKLLWDPETDVDVAIREFTDAYYGPAAQTMRDYLTLIHDTICLNEQRHVRIFSPTESYLNDPVMLSKAFGLFAKAEKQVAGNAVLLRRIKNAKLPILYTKLNLARGNMFLQNGRLARKGMESVGCLDEFEAICKAEKVTHVGEGKHRALQGWLERQRSVTQDSQILTLESKDLRMEILPEFGGRIWRLQSKKDSRQLLRIVGNNKRGFNPEDGGMEWYSTDVHRGPGYAETFKVVKRGKDFVELASGVLSNGCVMTRRIEFLRGRTGFRIISEVRGTGKIIFRCHPEFAVSSTQHAVLCVKGADGKMIEQSLADKKDPLAERELWLQKERMPAGEWSILDKKTGIRITNRFKPGEIGMTYCNWNGAQKRVNLELWSAETDARGGKATRTDVEYEVTLP